MDNQFPKKCACCGLVWSQNDWGRLRHKGVVCFDGEAIDLRDCECTSTMAVRVPADRVCQGCGDRLAVEGETGCPRCLTERDFPYEEDPFPGDAYHDLPDYLYLIG